MNWHRLFGFLLTDFFAGSPFDVELEKDLSVKKQILDVVILRKRQGQFAGRLPDGFDKLAPHNLLTFKTYWDSKVTNERDWSCPTRWKTFVETTLRNISRT